MSDRPLPSSWIEVSIADIADLNTKAFSALEDAQHLPATFVSMSHVEAEFGGIDVSSARPLGDVARGYTSFVEGDVLFAKITPCMENGKVAVVPKLPETVGFGSTEFHVLRATDATLPHWLAYYLSQREFRRQARQDMTGSAGQLRVAAPWLANKAIPLAPRHEQGRVVAKLEELLTDLDAGVAELEAARKKLARYRQSLLKAAVEGTLTADWRAERARRGDTFETGPQLLERILRERRARWEEKQLEKFEAQGKAPPKGWRDRCPHPTQLRTDELPPLPEGWTWSSLGHCFEVAVGATPSRKEPSYWGGDIPWVSSGEVRFSRIVETKERITAMGLGNSSTEVNPVGSVMLGMIGEGKTRGQVALLGIEAANNQNCAAIRVSETDIPPQFIYYWLWSRYEKTRSGSSGNNQPALNKSLVERIPFPIGPLAEMRAVVDMVDALLSRVDALESEVAMSLDHAQSQRQNILRAAFSGQLVPQDPTDEPASVLLARIRAERTKQASSAPKRRASARTTKAQPC